MKNKISLRNYMAAKAMQGMCSGAFQGTAKELAEMAYLVADEMMIKSQEDPDQ